MATLKDVAREAGLTVSTVSRILNNRGYISEQSRDKVQDAMRKLNYQPNEMARSLRMKSTNMIGLIVPMIEHPYFSKMIHYIEQYAGEQGFKLLLCNTQGNVNKVRDYLDLLSSNRVSGIILLSGRVQEELLQKISCPLIAVERQLKNCTATVECDNYQGGVLAAEALIESGCQSLLQVGGDPDMSMPADQRAEGFAATCRQKQIDYHLVPISETAFENMNYTEILEKALSQYPLTDGIFCTSDYIAAQAINLCHQKGMHVPVQMKIVGFDDVYLAELTSPAITTIHQPVEEMARLSISLIKRTLEGKPVEKHHMLPVHMVYRASALGRVTALNTED